MTTEILFHGFWCMVTMWVVTQASIVTNGTSERSELVKLRRLENRVFQILTTEYPEYAFQFGNRSDALAGKVTSFSDRAFERRLNRYSSVLKSIAKIDVTKLNFTKALDVDILKAFVQTYVKGYQWKRYSALNPINIYNSIIRVPAHISSAKYKTMVDYAPLFQHIYSLPIQIKTIVTSLKAALETNTTYYYLTMDDLDYNMERAMLDAYYKPFRTVLEQSDIPSDQWSSLRSEAQGCLEQISNSFKELRIFFEEEYLPNAPTGLGVGTLPRGEEFYRACLGWHLGDPEVTAEEVYDLGLREISRIENRLYQVLQHYNHTGDILSFFNAVDSSYSNYSLNKSALDLVIETVTEKINPRLHELFYNISLPALSFEGVPQAGLMAAYHKNVVYVSTVQPNPYLHNLQMGLSLHEANPGHHYQEVYSATNDMPSYRKHRYVGHPTLIPLLEPYFTAYLEGWATYAEYLGEELGLFDHPYDLLGRLRSEMFRACRMVVDVGIHTRGMSKESAVSYLVNYTGISVTMATSEVRRYVKLPGRAPSYKFGEIRLKQLRKLAEETLGYQFDIREFHHQILRLGPVPLTIVQKAVLEWLSGYQSKTDSLSHSSSLHLPPYLLMLLNCIFVGVLLLVMAKVT